MLEYDIHRPEGLADGARLIVLLHGRGADKDDMSALAPFLGPAVVVTPRAPFHAAPWGYGPGFAWYRYLGENRPDEESFSASLDAVGELLAELPAQLSLPIGEVVLGGFSQGGTLSLGFALHRPGIVHRVVNFSGFLADHPRVQVTPETVAGVRIFWGHGTHDPNIPFTMAVDGRRILQRADADLTAHDYPMAHTIAREELDDLRRWLDDVRGSTEGLV